MAHKLPELKYKYSDLEPHIDAQTMEIHHSKHHAGYITKLNAALEGEDDLQKMSIEELLDNLDKVPEERRQAVTNNGGGHANHSLFWKVMGPESGKPDTGLTNAIDSAFGSFEKFQSEFTQKALGVFGSGWVFLVIDGEKLACKRHSFQNSPLMSGKTPILGLDVWEHAYYLKYQNMRADYVKAWWSVVNWKSVSALYKEAIPSPYAETVSK